jgi:K+/H+ antiporter YhaU regulatory subunit KhtT
MESCLPDLEIASFRIPEGSPAIGQTLQETEMRKLYGVTLLAVNRSSRIITNPPADLIFEARDVLFVVGDAQDIRKVRDLFGSGESLLSAGTKARLAP